MKINSDLNDKSNIKITTFNQTNDFEAKKKNMNLIY